MRILLICLTILSAGSANALSCLRPDAVRLFEQARDAKEAFYIVKGGITLLEPARKPQQNSEIPTLTRARVTGTALSNSGFNVVFNREVMIEARCFGPWCGDPESLDGERIMAIETGSNTLTLHVDPCGGNQLSWDQSGEDRLLACHLEGDCKPAEF